MPARADMGNSSLLLTPMFPLSNAKNGVQGLF
jgi:hypothetical protein